MQKVYPGIPISIAEWKGQHIVDFQSELQRTQHEHISEKWFYNHMKSEREKLPRVDILNFLSQFVGYKNWDEFKHYHTNAEEEPDEQKAKKVTYALPLVLVILVTIIYFVFKFFNAQEYTFCFYDNVSKQAISNNIIEVTLLEEKESPRNYLCDRDGCFSIKTNRNKIHFVVEAPYYHRDTIVRRLNSFNRSERIRLQVDDYAIMLHYFSNSKVQDWIKRKEDLNAIFSDNAKIFQVYEGTVGMEIYNKWEFINKLSLPTSGLRDIVILDKKYQGEQITHLRFKQNGTGE